MLLSSAMPRSYDAGTQRPDAPIRATRSSAAGLISAIQSPPSEAKHFCGEK